MPVDTPSRMPDSTHPRRRPHDPSRAHRPGDNDTAPSPLSRRTFLHTGAVDFDAELDAGGLRSRLHPDDPFETDWVAEDQRLGEFIVRYRRPGGEWETVETSELVEAGWVDFLVRDSSVAAPGACNPLSPGAAPAPRGGQRHSPRRGRW